MIQTIQEKTMRQIHIPRRLMLSGSVAAAVFAAAGLSASAQTATTAATTNAVAAQRAAAAAAPAAKNKPAASTPDMVLEACQRTQARFDKFQKSGIPEEFGSEEPFTFQPNKKC
jgi:hypothetical protein